MAIKELIALDGVQDVMSSLRELGDVGESTFQRIKAAVDGNASAFSAFSSSFDKLASFSIAGVVGGIAALGAAFTAMAVSSAASINSMENLGQQMGASVEDASSLISAFARSGAEVDNLAGSFRRAAVSISQQWPVITKSVIEAGTTTRSVNLSVERSLSELQKATIAEANAEQNASLQRQANANSVANASLALADAEENLRVAMGGERDPVADAQRARERAIQGVADAQLRLAQAQQKAAQEEEEAAAKARDAAIARETAELNLAKAREAALETQKNSIQTLVTYVNNLAAGMSNAGMQVNASVENIFKGIIASVGLAGTSFKNISGDIASIGAPSVINVLMKTADVMKGMSSDTEKMALAVQVLGRGVGQDMVEFLSQGSAAVQAYMDKVKALGLEFTGPMAAAARQFRVSLFTMKDDIKRISDQMGILFAPVLGPLIDAISQAIERNREGLLRFAATIASYVQPVVDTFIRVLSGAPDQVKDQWLLDLIHVFEMAGTVITSIVLPAFQSILDVANFVARELQPIFGEGFNGIELIVGLFVANFVTVHVANMIAALGLLGSAFTAFGAAAGVALLPVFAAFATGLAGILGILYLVDKATFDAVNKMATDMKELATKMWENFSKPSEKSADDIQKRLDALKNKIGTTGRDGANAWNNAMSKIKGPESAAEGFGNLKNNIDSVARTAEEAANTIYYGGKTAAEAWNGVYYGFKQIGDERDDQTQKNDKDIQKVQTLHTWWNAVNDVVVAIDSNLASASTLSEILQKWAQALLPDFNNLATAAWNIAAAMAAAAAAASQMSSSSGGGSGGATFNERFGTWASGGYITGPGTGTSDSILAWLSNREFVHPARAVAYYGLEFMEAIRQMRFPRELLMGGPRFASGGLVAVNTGNNQRPFVLSLPGFGSFRGSIAAPDQVVDALSRASAFEQLSQAGRSPGWRR